MTIVIFVGPDTVVNKVAMMMSCCRSRRSMIFVGLIEKLRNIAWNEAIIFIVESRQSGVHLSYMEGFPL